MRKSTKARRLLTALHELQCMYSGDEQVRHARELMKVCIRNELKALGWVEVDSKWYYKRSIVKNFKRLRPL